MPDPRVVHLWDSQAEVGRLFGASPEYNDFVRGPLAWDIYFMYGPGEEWQGDVPLPVLSSGSTVISKSDRLREAITPLVE